MPPLNAYIDLHCERLQDGFFEEPLNTLSNFSFIIAAFYLLRFLKSRNKRPFLLYILIFLSMFIGFGSMTFHVTARMWAAMYFDILPIAIFAILFMFLFTHHVLRLGILGTILLVALLFVENFIFKSYIGKAPDGYVSLIPSAFFLVLLCIYMHFTKNPSTRYFSIATAIAVIAIFFRATDSYLCLSFPYGTHFVWHSLMGGFVYITVKELIIRHRAFDQL